MHPSLQECRKSMLTRGRAEVEVVGLSGDFRRNFQRAHTLVQVRRSPGHCHWRAPDSHGSVCVVRCIALDFLQHRCLLLAGCNLAAQLKTTGRSAADYAKALPFVWRGAPV